jgi:hypothetical protein
MVSTVPADLLELKARFETWRTNRKYVREPIPDELRQAAAEMCRRYPPSLVGRILKLDPSRLKRPATKTPARTRNQPATAFFKLPTEVESPQIGSSAPHSLTGISAKIQLGKCVGG